MRSLQLRYWFNVAPCVSVLGRFEISLDDLFDGEEIASCPSCTLRIRVIFDDDALLKFEALYQQAQAGEAEATGTAVPGVSVGAE